MKVRVIEKKQKCVEEDCANWANEISTSYDPDIVVFIANSGFVYGKVISDTLGVNLGYIKAVRSGNSSKNVIGSFAKYIPKCLVKIIISSPMKFYIHSKKTDRHVYIPDSLKESIENGAKKILLVDDAVDTGWTIKQVVEELEKTFDGVEIRTASYAVSAYSQKVRTIV